MTDILNDPIQIDNPSANTDAVRIAVLIDESGSMANCATETINNLNGYIDEQRTNDKLVLVSVYTFNSRDGVKCRYASVDAKQADHLWNKAVLTEANRHLRYVPDGGTPLYDAIGTVISKETGDTPTLVVILTDGMENASKEFSHSSIQALMNQQEEAGWTFVYLMAGLTRTESVAYASNMMGRNYEGATMSYSKGMEAEAFRGLVASSAGWEKTARGMNIVSGKVLDDGFDKYGASAEFFEEGVRDIKKKK